MYTKPAYRKDAYLGFGCTHLEKRYLALSAKKAGQSMSRYLHGMMLQGYPGKPKSLPPEMQSAIGQLMQVAGLLHPLSRKRLNGDELNALERAEVKEVIRQIQGLIQQVKNYLP